MACVPMNNNDFWREIRFDVKPEEQSVKALHHVGDSIIFLIGAKAIAPTNWDLKTDRPFFRISTDGGKSWKEKTDFDCNSLNEILFFNDIVIIIDGWINHEYHRDGSLYSDIAHKYYKFYIAENKWEELKITDERISGLSEIISSEIYIAGNKQRDESQPYFYLVTRDGGKNWIEHSLPFHMWDHFYEKCVQGNKLWGIRFKYIEGKTTQHLLVSISLDTWEVIDEIPLGTLHDYTDEKGKSRRANTHEITKIVAQDETLYLLGKDETKNMGHIWKMNVNDKKIEVQENFELTKDQSPIELFIHKDKFIVVYMDMTNFIPTYILLYKKFNEKSWHKENFPYFTDASCISFNNGVLMGIAEGNKIYYREF